MACAPAAAAALTADAQLMQEAGKGDVEKVKALLAAGADPNEREPASGSTPLFYAVQSGNIGMVRVLLAAGADPSPRVTWGGGRSALYWTLTSGNVEMALVLVKAGANANVMTDYADTPLRLAARGNTPRHLELVQALLDARVDLEAGQTPLRVFPEYSPNDCRSPSRSSDCEVIVTGTRRAPGTALGIAAATGSLEIVQALLAAGARVEARQDGWRTPLMVAALGGRPDVVRALLAAGADVEARDSSEQTALMLASAPLQAVSSEAGGSLVPTLALLTGVTSEGRQAVVEILQSAAAARK